MRFKVILSIGMLSAVAPMHGMFSFARAGFKRTALVASHFSTASKSGLDYGQRMTPEILSEQEREEKLREIKESNQKEAEYERNLRIQKVIDDLRKELEETS